MDNQLLKKYSQVYVPGSYQERFPGILKSRQERHLIELSTEGLPCVFFGVDLEPGQENVWMMNSLRIFQEPSVLWLTGLNQKGVRLVFDPLNPNKEDQIVLFVPAKLPERLFWDGEILGLPPKEDSQFNFCKEEISALTGISNIQVNLDFNEYILRILPPSRQMLAFYHDYRVTLDDFDLAHIKEYYFRPKSKGDEFDLGLFKEKLVNKTDHNYKAYHELVKFLKITHKEVSIYPWVLEHYMLRLPLEEGQVVDADLAQAVTLEAFQNTVSDLTRFKTEHNLARFLEYMMMDQTTSGLAFPSIVAGGKNATTLHYLKNDEDLVSGDLILMDFGARVGTQHSDISRTFPVNGTYNPLQKLLYDIVLNTQIYHQNMVKPGANLNELTFKSWTFLEQELKEKFFDLGGRSRRIYHAGGACVDSQNHEELSLVNIDSVIKPHGISHLMGEQEHDGDPFRLYGSLPLQEGWMISNEPGIYGHFEIDLNGELFSEWIGIRIEDDLILTKDGCRNLSENFPHTTDEIETLMKNKGV